MTPVLIGVWAFFCKEVAGILYLSIPARCVVFSNMVMGHGGVLLLVSVFFDDIAPETAGLEDDFPFGKASWQVLCSCLFGGV